MSTQRHGSLWSAYSSSSTKIGPPGPASSLPTAEQRMPTLPVPMVYPSPAEDPTPTSARCHDRRARSSASGRPDADSLDAERLEGVPEQAVGHLAAVLREHLEDRPYPELLGRPEVRIGPHEPFVKRRALRVGASGEDRLAQRAGSAIRAEILEAGRLAELAQDQSPLLVVDSAVGVGRERSGDRPQHAGRRAADPAVVDHAEILA